VLKIALTGGSNEKNGTDAGHALEKNSQDLEELQQI
jgi:hypothetical protein